MFGLSVRLSVCCPSVNSTPIPLDAISRRLWKDFDETWYKSSACEWPLLNRFSRSKVKRQGYVETRCTSAAEALFRLCSVEAQCFHIFTARRIAVYAMVILSVCLSVALVNSAKTGEHIIKLFSMSDSPIIIWKYTINHLFQNCLRSLAIA